MARQQLKARAFIDIDGEPRLWYEIDEHGSIIWHLPKNIPQKAQMLKNIGRSMSEYHQNL